MIDGFVGIPTPAGPMQTFFVHPPSGGPFPAVVLYMDIWGPREELFDVARNVASVGYYVMVPDLYHRHGKVVPGHRNTQGRMISHHHLSPERQQAALEPLMKTTDAMVLEDTAAIIAHADRTALVRRGAMGCFGYCLGGRIALLVAGSFPERFKACAGMHASGVVTDKPNSVHLVAAKAQGELYLGYGALDAFATPAIVATVSKTMATSAARFEFLVHDGVQHGYALPDRDVYDKRATFADWSHIFAMFHRQIPPGYGV